MHGERRVRLPLAPKSRQTFARMCFVFNQVGEVFHSNKFTEMAISRVPISNTRHPIRVPFHVSVRFSLKVSPRPSIRKLDAWMGKLYDPPPHALISLTIFDSGILSERALRRYLKSPCPSLKRVSMILIGGEQFSYRCMSNFFNPRAASVASRPRV